MPVIGRAAKTCSHQCFSLVHPIHLHWSIQSMFSNLDTICTFSITLCFRYLLNVQNLGHVKTQANFNNPIWVWGEICISWYITAFSIPQYMSGSPYLGDRNTPVSLDSWMIVNICQYVHDRRGYLINATWMGQSTFTCECWYSANFRHSL